MTEDENRWVKVPITGTWSEEESNQRQDWDDAGIIYCRTCMTRTPPHGNYIMVMTDEGDNEWYCQWECLAMNAAAISAEFPDEDDPGFTWEVSWA